MPSIVIPLLGLAGLVLVHLAWLHYLWLIPRERVPDVPVAHKAVMGIGVLFGAVAASAGWAQGLVWGLLWTAVLVPTVGLTAFFAWLLRIAPLPDGHLVAQLDAPLPDFSALDHTGRPRSIAEWRGRPLLLKFFRGHW